MKKLNAQAGHMLETRRRVLGLMGGASVAVGGLSLLSACKDDVVGSENVPVASATSTTRVIPPAYTATDNDRLNFILQIHYLLAAYFQRALDGSTLSASLTSGSGTAGQVTGGRQVTFSDPVLVTMVREAAEATIARIAYLRRTLGSATTAQPAINIAGGQGSAFQAISTTSTSATTFFDPYASDKDFLLGATALFAVATSAAAFMASLVDVSLRGKFGALSAGIAANDSAMRNAMFALANLEPSTPPAGQQTLFTRANMMSDGRDQFDGPGDLDQGLGGFASNNWVNANIGITDSNNVQVRRSPEQALGVLYASVNSVSSGGFFPAGMNGVIRNSGANA